MRSPLKEFQEKVGNDCNNWMDRYSKVQSAAGCIYVVKEEMSDMLVDVGELIKKCSESPTAAAILKQGMDALKQEMEKTLEKLNDAVDERPVASLCRMQELYHEIGKDVAACKLQQTIADRKVEELEGEMKNLEDALEKSREELQRAREQTREVAKKNEMVKKKLRQTDTPGSPPIGTRKRRMVRRLDSDDEPTPTDMECQAGRWERSLPREKSLKRL